MRRCYWSLLAGLCVLVAVRPAASAAGLKQMIRTAQSKVVKIYGAGGLKQLEAYQSGILISPQGHVLTALSYVLDTDDLAVILDDGRRWQAEIVGSDPLTELALLKLPVEEQELPHFDFPRAAARGPVEVGQRILALSNLYGIATGDEPVSVMQGVITAVAPLQARRGAFQANYREQVYVLDAYANNPGAAGGALIDWHGRLLGVLGKELRSEVTGTWLNYALPAPSIATTVNELIVGRSDRSRIVPPPPEQPHSPEALGILLIPDVVPRTPPYIDSVLRDTAAELAGLRCDDLIVFVGDEPTDSRRSVVKQIAMHDRNEPLAIGVLRDGALRQFTLVAAIAADEGLLPANQPRKSAPLPKDAVGEDSPAPERASQKSTTEDLTRKNTDRQAPLDQRPAVREDSVP